MGDFPLSGQRYSKWRSVKITELSRVRSDGINKARTLGLDAGNWSIGGRKSEGAGRLVSKNVLPRCMLGHMERMIRTIASHMTCGFTCSHFTLCFKTSAEL